MHDCVGCMRMSLKPLWYVTVQPLSFNWLHAYGWMHAQTELIEDLMLEKHADKLTKEYRCVAEASYFRIVHSNQFISSCSGGNKRKLSTAIA